ncbi:MAG: tol-pal system protein YbgF [Halioglobus sp.]
MQKLTRALALSGLVICAGPLALEAHAQGYVDVEAERASAKPSGSTGVPEPTVMVPQSAPVSPSTAADPYGTSPAKAYPATSYGVNTAAPTAQPMAAPSAPTGGQSADQNLGNLFYQLQQLQQEVMMLNGKVEEQAHELRKLREQNLERYVDVDRRLSEVGGGSGGSPAAAATTGGAATIASQPPAGQASVAELPGEGEAYRAAYALVRNQQFDQAVDGFQQFLQNYPAGKYAPNAHYWLGELYLVIVPADLESSRQAFMLLLDQYPDNSKIPDALYKLGKVHFMKGNRDRAKEFFDRVIAEYGSSNNSAAKLARDFLSENY